MARGKNAYLNKLESKHRYELAFMRNFALRLGADVMLIAASDEFGFGSDRLERLEKRFWSVYNEYAELIIEDAKDDRALDYTKGKIDGKLEQIMGDCFEPWEERYG